MSTQLSKGHFSGGLSKILEEQWQVDVRLKAGYGDEFSTVPAHKVILAARSEVFKKMFASDKYKASRVHEIVTLSEMKHEELKALVEFIYSDGSVISAKAKKHVRSLYLAAEKYEIPHLRNLCRKEIISSLNSSNALHVLELAQIPFDKALNDAAFSTIIKNINMIVGCDEFKVFMVSNPNLAVEIMKASLNQTGSKGLAVYRGRDKVFSEIDETKNPMFSYSFAFRIGRRS